MKTIDYLEALKASEEKKFFPLYVLIGSTFFLKQKLVETLKENFLGDEGSLRVIDLEEDPLSYFFEEEATLGLFAARRLYFIKNLQKLKAAMRQQFLSSLLLDNPGEIVLVEYEHDTDIEFRELETREGAFVKEPVLDEKQLRSFINRSFASREKKPLPQAVENLLSLTDRSLEALIAEIEKISLFAGGKDLVTPEMVRAVIYPADEAVVFELVDAIVSGQYSCALSLLCPILREREMTGRLIYLLFRQFRILFYIGGLRGVKRLDYYRLAQKLSEHPFVVKKCLAKGARFSQLAALRAMEKISLIDKKIKQGGENPSLLFERLILEFKTAS